MTSQTPQGGDQVTVGTQLPRKSSLSLPPAPSLHKNWGTVFHILSPSCWETAPGDINSTNFWSARHRQPRQNKDAVPSHILPNPEGPETWEIDIFAPGPRATGRLKADGSLSRPNLKAPT